jgi:hypothetical protein
MKTRSLKIEATGDAWRGEIKPKIRLTGYWLERAGFKPGHRIEVQCPQPGTLSIHFIESAESTGR